METDGEEDDVPQESLDVICVHCQTVGACSCTGFGMESDYLINLFDDDASSIVYNTNTI